MRVLREQNRETIAIIRRLLRDFLYREAVQPYMKQKLLDLSSFLDQSGPGSAKPRPGVILPFFGNAKSRTAPADPEVLPLEAIRLLPQVF
jgi:hypothetical protein